jgi:hypothetical protein
MREVAAAANARFLQVVCGARQQPPTSGAHHGLVRVRFSNWFAMRADVRPPGDSGARTADAALLL